MQLIRSAALAALLVTGAAACNRADGGAEKQADAPVDSTAAAAQKRDILPPGVSVDTQKVDTVGGKETPQQDPDDQ